MSKENSNTRNFCIIAHVDHGKSTLADRFLEITGTVEKRQMREQYLDQLESERERGITIKMAPVRMLYRGPTRTTTRTNAEGNLIYEDITYKIRGACFSVRKNLGLGHKEIVYQNALEEEFKKLNLNFEKEKIIDIYYDNKKIGVYRPDFIVENKVVVELKALLSIGKNEEHQIWTYLRGSEYLLGLLINFGRDLEIKRVVYDTARLPRRSASIQRESASIQRESASIQRESAYILNLIDTPGHNDFKYEVSRALAAVEGAILLVDASQGIQAQTLANFESAKQAGLKIIGAVNKVDLNPPQLEEVVDDLAALLEVEREEIIHVSGKTGFGIEKLLEMVIKQVPPPLSLTNNESLTNERIKIRELENNSPLANISRALIFDSLYDDHRGVMAFIRVFGGEFERDSKIKFIATGATIKIKEVGYFHPQLKPCEKLGNGEIGYLATGLKDPGLIKIGDTIIGADLCGLNAETRGTKNLALPDFTEPQPVVFVSFYPEESDDYENLKKALAKLRLTDSSLKFESDASEVLGRGFKGGFLGRLHFEITAERLEKEFKIRTVHSFPSVAYRIYTRTSADGTQTNAEETQINAEETRKNTESTRKNAEVRRRSASIPRQSASIQRRSASIRRESAFITVTNPKDFLVDRLEVLEPITKIEILTPTEYLGNVLSLKELFRFKDIQTNNLGNKNKIIISAKLPLADLISDFDDKLKSLTRGYGSLSYEIIGYEPGDLEKLEILIAGRLVSGLTRILPKEKIQREGRMTIEKLRDLLPRQQFAQAIQAAVRGKIIARETVPAMRKDVTGYLYGGDRTRKMKLWKKQQTGKARLKEMAQKGETQVKIPASIFKELLKK